MFVEDLWNLTFHKCRRTHLAYRQAIAGFFFSSRLKKKLLIFIVLNLAFPSRTIVKRGRALLI